jgi:phosphoserine aminotransferase
MNVTFTTPSKELDARFVEEATAAGLSGLKGHRSVGGVRASIYNAFPKAGCEALASFMRDFARKNG